MIIIIGAGVGGLSLGWRLLQRGHAVTILEKNHVGAGASGASGAYLEPRPGKGKLRALEWASHAMWPEFAEQLQGESGVDIGFRHDGVSYIAFAETLDKLRKAYDFHESSGWQINWLEGDALIDFEPALSSEVVAAFHLPQVYHVDARLTCEALAKGFEKAGGILRENEAVISVQQAGDRLEINTGKGACFSAGKLVIAAALGTNEIKGLPADMPKVRPVRGVMLELQMNENAPLVHRPIKRPDGVLLPLGGGRLLVGSSHEDGEAQAKAPDAIIDKFMVSARRAIPQIDDLPLLEKRAGIRTFVGDGLLRLGQCKDMPNVFYSLSHAGAGFLRAPVIAEELAAVIGDGIESRWIEPFFKT